MTMLKIAHKNRGVLLAFAIVSALVMIPTGGMEVSAQPRDKIDEPEPTRSEIDAEDENENEKPAVTSGTKDLETRLIRQIQLLQRQINQLSLRIDAIEDEPAE